MRPKSRRLGDQSREGFFLFSDAAESVQNVFRVFSRDFVKAEKAGVEFRHEFGPLRWFPLVNGGIKTCGLRQRAHIVGRTGQL